MTGRLRHLNGNNGYKPVPEAQLGRTRKRVKGFASKKCATVNAEAIVKIYYECYLTKPSIDFVLGMAVDRLLYSTSSSSSYTTSSTEVLGIVLEDGRELRAQTTILATGAWSGRLVNLDGVMEAQAVGIAYVQLTLDEYAQYKDIACHTNFAPGINMFTPIGGLLKVLRRAGGVRNTVELQMATDGSLHGWKFLSLLGEFVVDSLTGKLDEDLARKWSWENKIGAEMAKSGFMRKGQQRELRDMVPQNRDLRL